MMTDDRSSIDSLSKKPDPSSCLTKDSWAELVDILVLLTEDSCRKEEGKLVFSNQWDLSEYWKGGYFVG